MGESISADPLSAWTNVVPATAEYIFDPDPAIVRSGLLDVLAEQYSMQRLDAEEEYLTALSVSRPALSRHSGSKQCFQEM